MALYEYKCACGQKFERLRPMSECEKPSDCPDCGKESGRLVSSSHFRMAEFFRVVDSGGNITQEKQVGKSVPDWQDTKPLEYHPDVPKPIISRGGGVYVAHGSPSNATV